MKKILFILLFCFTFIVYLNINLSYYCFAKSTYTTYTYAQVLQDNIYLYKSPTTAATLNAYFELPKTYFVLIISSIDNTYYKVQYKDIVGYVLKTSVSPIKETPQNPYPSSITFRVYTNDGLNMIDNAFNTKNATSTGKASLLENLEYYGKISGEELIPNRGTTWYYGKNNNNQKGYLYAGYCDDLSTILPNTEIVTKIEYPSFNDENGYLYNLVNLSNPLKILLILLVTLPCIFLVYLLFKPFELQKNKPKQTKSKQQNQALNKIQKIIDDETL
ncbi:MAG: hypothetical protein IJD48_00245 [Clostridia bacterium]|nr:hypothetical protein [Clostridia bacterium]